MTDRVVVVREPTVVTVAAAGVQGPPGPQGPPGAAGGAAHVHIQTAPSATWVINHGLGRKVNVSLFDATETVINADVTHGTTGQTTITFPSPTSGSAYIS